MIEKISKDERVLIHLTTKKNGEGQPRTYGILVVHPTNSEDNEEIFVKDGDLVPVLNLLLVNKNATNCVLDDIANLVNELHVSKLNAVQRLLEDARDKVSGLNSATDEEHEKNMKFIGEQMTALGRDILAVLGNKIPADTEHRSTATTEADERRCDILRAICADAIKCAVFGVPMETIGAVQLKGFLDYEKHEKLMELVDKDPTGGMLSLLALGAMMSGGL